MGVIVIDSFKQAFTPLAISGCQFWIDSDDASSFTFSSGVLVSQWNDKSGNARHVAQATPANQPSRNGTMNSRTTVVFVRATTVLKSSTFTTVSQPLTIAATFKETGGFNDTHIVGLSGTSATLYRRSTGNWGIYAGTEIGATAADTSAHSMIGEFNGASSKIWLDGTNITSGNPGASGWAKAIIGDKDAAGSGLTGQVAEVVVYNSILSAGDRQTLEAYLRTKWGTP